MGDAVGMLLTRKQGYYGCTTCQGRHVCRSVSPQYSQCHDPKANVAVVTALVYDGIVAEK